MTSSQRIFFGVIASVLLAVGLVKAAEAFDPVIFGDRPANADDDWGDPVSCRPS